MFFRSLKTRIYFWLLGAITLTVAATAVVLFLISHTGPQGFAEHWVLPEVRTGRDIAQNLFKSGIPPDRVAELLAPIAEHNTFSISVVDARGKRVLLLHPASVEAEAALPTTEQIAQILERGSVVSGLRNGSRGAGLPIELGNGEQGVFFVGLHRRFWSRPEAPLRFFAAVAVILFVAWLLSWPLARHLTRPMKQLADTADRLGRGDLSARIDLRGKRRHRRGAEEIETLAQSFNTMADNLQGLVLGHKQLLGDISHELRSPLARLKLALELARGEAGPEAADALHRAEKQSDAIDDMIGELLIYSRLETAPYELNPEPVAPHQMMEEAARLLHAEREARKIEFALVTEDEKMTVEADRRLLLRALGNVAQNAVAHAPVGSTVRMEVRREPGRLTFTITDAGAGVPDEMRERIFQPFVRTDAARSRATGGVGLGLAIARRCMEAHGGGATAGPGAGGQGFAISLWLPLHDEKAAARGDR